jgi:hypothetical protein
MGGTDHPFAVQIEIRRDALECAGAVEDGVGEPRRIGRRGHQRNGALGPGPVDVADGCRVCVEFHGRPLASLKRSRYHGPSVCGTLGFDAFLNLRKRQSDLADELKVNSLLGHWRRSPF